MRQTVICLLIARVRIKEANIGYGIKRVFSKAEVLILHVPPASRVIFLHLAIVRAGGLGGRVGITSSHAPLGMIQSILHNQAIGPGHSQSTEPDVAQWGGSGAILGFCKD